MKLMNHLLMASLVFVSTVSNAKVSSDVNATIVGGIEATAGEFPFIVSLHGSYGGHFCGGSLIKKNWVLTAAHCVRGATIKSVVIGLHDQKDMSKAEKLGVKRTIVHPQYNTRTMDFDIALVELAEDSKFTPIAIATSDIEIPEATDDQIMATTAGWGALKEGSYSLPNKLQKVDVPLITNEACNLNYKNAITDRMLCAGYPQGGKDACQGDSGGPLFVADEDGQQVLAGVVSWGQGCARKGYAGVYAKVSEAASWIEQSAR